MIDNNTPILNSAGYDFDDLVEFKSKLPKKPDKKQDGEFTRQALDAIMDAFIAANGHISVVKLSNISGLTMEQVKSIKAELDYALAEYGVE